MQAVVFLKFHLKYTQFLTTLILEILKPSCSGAVSLDGMASLGKLPTILHFVMISTIKQDMLYLRTCGTRYHASKSGHMGRAKKSGDKHKQSYFCIKYVEMYQNR